MPYVLIRHTIDDYTSWRSAFDGHASARGAAGCLGGRLFHVADDRTEVVVLFEWDSLKNARTFADSAALDEWMYHSGVEGRPEVTFLERFGDVPV